MSAASHSESPRRLLDGLLLALLVGIAFLLGCYEMGDSDVWWHLRGGQWILEHGRVPGLDPFTFGSADKVWVDIHWSYEVLLTLTYRAGGVGALVLLGASFGCAAFLACLTTHRRSWPATVLALSWLPAFVLLGFRLDPRPEILSLFYLACYLAMLRRVESRPTLVWLLPPLQILWVNAQGLFILGPILLTLFVLAHAAQLGWHSLRGTRTWGPAERRWWYQVGAAVPTVAAACLVNPYFVQGARFPFDLFPKVAVAGNIYKQYIDELMSPRDFVRDATVRVAGTNWFFLAFYFLLLLVPLSFLYPALWRAWHTAWESRRPRGVLRLDSWLGGLAATFVLLLASTLTLSGQGVPGVVLAVGDNVPVLLVLGGLGGALLLRRTCPQAAVLAGVGGLALAAWMVWLQTLLLAGGRGLWSGTDLSPTSALPVALAGLAATGLALRWGADPFRLLLAAAFAYLGLQALQNWSRFALVAGLVLSWNWAEWSGDLIAAAGPPGRARQAAGWGLRGALVALLGLWFVALITDQYYIHTGEPRHFAFREQPLEFAHEAAVFAGSPGLPQRALVYGLGQTGVYDFHNAPRCKPFMDGRLEMPDRHTFETYVHVEDWLRQRDPRWEKEVADMGNPLLLLEHQNNYSSEALLLTHPQWRCIYHDALAAVFLHRDQGDTQAFPSVDFAACHFNQAGAASVPDVPGAAAREEKALFNLAASLPRSPEVNQRWRLPVLLRALDRAEVALMENPHRPDVWVVLGNCYWNLNPDLTSRPPGPAEEWHAEQGIYWAQATFCLHQALANDPEHAAAWRYLFQVYRVRGMADVQLAAGEQWLAHDPRVTARDREQVEQLGQALARFSGARAPTTEESPGFLDELRSRPGSAARRFQDAETHGLGPLSWPLAERVGCLYLHLGEPAKARRIWQEARHCPSVALRQCRLAATFWVERDFEAALRLYRDARESDPQLGEAAWGLAMLYAQRGEAGPMLEACREGFKASLTERQRSDLEALQRLLPSR